ncbi:hypothetical protein V8E53_005790 [Lactarius tabidus]
MLGFAIPKHDTPHADPYAARAWTTLMRARGGKEWVERNAVRVLGGTSVSTEAGVGEYAVDGTVDPSVLGGSGLSLTKVDDYSSSPALSPAGRRLELSRTMDDSEGYRMDDKDEEDVMDLLFAASTSDEDFMPRPDWASVKARAARLLGRGDAKPFPDEVEPEHRIKHDNDDHDGHESDEDSPHENTMSAPAPVHLDSHPKKRRGTTLSSGSPSYCRHCRCNARRLKMRCTLVNAPAGEGFRKLFCDGCIEKRYPDVTFNLPAETFASPGAVWPGTEWRLTQLDRAARWRLESPRCQFLLPLVPHDLDKEQEQNPAKAAPAPVKKRLPATTAPTTTTNTQVLDSSWSATAVFTRQCVLTRQHGVRRPRPAPQFPYHLQYRLLLPTRLPNPRRNSKSNGTIRRETSQGARTSRGPSGSRLTGEEKTTNGKGNPTRERGSQGQADSILYFIGSLEPLLAAWRRNRRRRRRTVSLDANVDNPGQRWRRGRTRLAISTQMRRDLVGRVLGASYHRHGAGDGDGRDEDHAGGD